MIFNKPPLPGNYYIQNRCFHKGLTRSFMIRLFTGSQTHLSDHISFKVLPFHRTFLTLLYKTGVGCMPSPTPLPYFIFLQYLTFYCLLSHTPRMYVSGGHLFCSMPVSQMSRKEMHTRHVSSLSSLAITHPPPIVHYMSTPHNKSPKGERL